MVVDAKQQDWLKRNREMAGGRVPDGMVQPPVDGAAPVANPYAGKPLESAWTSGFNDGYAHPDETPKPPGDAAQDEKIVYAEGALAGREAWQASKPPNASTQAQPAPTPAPAAPPQAAPPQAAESNSRADRYIKALNYAADAAGGAAGNKLRALATPESVAIFSGFAIAYIAAQLTPAGWFADGIAVVTLVVSAAMIGKELSSIVDDVRTFIRLVEDPNGDLQQAGAALARAAVAVPIDIFIALIMHKAGSAAKPYIKPPNGMVDLVTPDGRVFQVPADAANQPNMQTLGGGSGGGNAPPVDATKPGGAPEAPAEPPPSTPPEPGPTKPATDAATQQHVHEGGKVNNPQSPYNGKWDGGGVHDWAGLENTLARDGFKLKSVTEDPATGTRRVAVERVGKDPRTGKETRGVIEKTIYPKRLTPAQIDEAGEAAFRSARQGEPGTKLDQPGTKTKPDGTVATNVKTDGTPADGYFEATVPTGDPPGPLRIQGWFKRAADGTETISSHAPMFDKNWPTVDPNKY